MGGGHGPRSDPAAVVTPYRPGGIEHGTFRAGLLRWCQGGRVELWTLIIATVSGTGVTVAAHRARRARARRLDLRRRLEQIHVDLPLDVRHLTPDLGRLTIQARVVRLILETPLHRVFESLMQETPWGRRERCDDYDLAVVEARRALWEWLRAVEQLGGADRALLAQLGLGVQRLRAVMRRPGVFERTDDVFEETLYPAAPDPELVTAALCQAMADLRGFEVALLSHRPDPYR